MSQKAVIDLHEQEVLTTFYCALYAVGIPLFLWRREREPIKSRCWMLAVLQVTYCLFDLSVRMSELNTQVPCLLALTNSIMTLPLWMYPYFLRSGKWREREKEKKGEKIPISFYFLVSFFFFLLLLCFSSFLSFFLLS